MNAEDQTPPISDEDLARQTQAGSLTAFEQLVSRYENRIYAFAMSACRNTANAQEITQATFVRAYQAMAQYDARQPLGPWLFAIARRKWLDIYRSKSLVTSDEPLPESPDYDDPSELLAKQEERKNLWLL